MLQIRKIFMASLIALTALLPLQACKNSGPTKKQQSLVQTETERFDIWLQDRFDETLARSPMEMTYMGDKSAQDRLDDNSELASAEALALTEVWLSELQKNFDPDRLDEQSRLSYRLWKYAAEQTLESAKYSDVSYAFQHMSGPHSSLPAFMANAHNITSEQDAEDYISRLQEFGSYLGESVAKAERQAQNEIYLPKFAYEKIRTAANNVITGQPFGQDEDSPLWADFVKKVEALDIPVSSQQALKHDARDALLAYVKPAYLDVIDMTVRHEAVSDDRDGVWKLPNGEAFYNSRLKYYTTTDMTAEEIHQIGLDEVARIKTEMQDILDQLGTDETLRAFFDRLRTDPKFLHTNTDEGREAYMDQARQYIASMEARLDELFLIRPKADLVVKRVEPYREASAFGAFYNGPSPDGTRPGTYYINLKDMNDLPIYQTQALAYHEGIPGHHMQVAIAKELTDVPKFRAHGRHTAYTEGWALYAERIPKDIGLYTDPYQDFGRLSMEIFRAARLVVDTGIHAKKWTRAEAIDYMMDNTANAQGDIRYEVDRYIVWPGQATAYKIGMIKIDELRQKAAAELGDDFDIGEFHSVILANGSVPLMILEELVTNWIAEKKK